MDMHFHLHIHTDINIDKDIDTDMDMDTYTYICIYMCMCMCVYIYMCVCVCARVCVCVRVGACVFKYLCLLPCCFRGPHQPACPARRRGSCPAPWWSVTGTPGSPRGSLLASRACSRWRRRAGKLGVSFAGLLVASLRGSSIREASHF